MLMVIVISGIIVLTDLKHEILPEFSLDIITITVEYRGAGPGRDRRRDMPAPNATCVHYRQLPKNSTEDAAIQTGSSTVGILN